MNDLYLKVRDHHWRESGRKRAIRMATIAAVVACAVGFAIGVSLPL